MRPAEPLLQLPSFAGVGRAEARLLVRSTELVRTPAAQSVLLDRGPARELFVVVRGALRAMGDDPWTARPGDVLGARALLTRTEQRTAFRATEPCLVACVGVDQARALMAGSPAFATAVAVSLSRELGRLEQTR